MSEPSTTRADEYDASALDHENQGYQKGLANRQVQMIAIGGAIGTGLFLGAGGRLASAGPALFLAYALCGIFVFFILRALGELVLHRPSSGSFVSYAREFFGEKAAYTAGWLYFLNWSMTSIVDTTAIATYMHYWTTFQAIPQWTLALIALLIVLTTNLISVKLFGELEFWASMIKVAALVLFIVVGAVFLFGRFDVGGHPTGPSIISSSGGFFPTGVLPLVLVLSGVVFAFSAVELVGIAAGETKEPHKIMPRAINSVILRVGVFYVGSLVLLALLVPYTDFSKTESPFVTFFAQVGFGGSGTLMNIVVLTAALSSLNAGLYSTGRILRSMAMNGSAPTVTARMNGNGVPWGGIVLTSCVTLLGVVLNAIVPGEAFEIVLNMAALGVIGSWATIVLCQLRLHSWWKKGILHRPSFRMPGAPVTGWLTLAFLFIVLVLTGFDYPIGTFTLATLVIIIPLLVAGWYACRKRVAAAAAEREGLTGPHPVIAQRPQRSEDDDGA